MAATKKQSPAKAAAAKRTGKIPTPEPDSSTRASPRKASPANTKKSASPAKKATSPAKQAAAKKATSPEKKSPSPAKKAASPAKKATSPGRRAASPAKKAASPTRKATSPDKKVTPPEPTMRRSTRRTANASPIVDPGLSAHQSIEQPDGPRKSATKGATSKRSPTKSPTKTKSPAKSPTREHHEVPSFPRPISRSQPTALSTQNGPGRRYTSVDEYDKVIEAGGSYAKFVIAFEEESYERTMADHGATPDPPEILPIAIEDWALAWVHGFRRANRELNVEHFGIPPSLHARARMVRTFTETETAQILAQYANMVPGPSMFDSPGQKLGSASKLSPGKSTKSTTFDLKRMDRALTSPAAPVKALAGARSPTASPGKQSSVRSTPAVPSQPAIKSTTKTTAATQLPTPKQDPGRGPVISTTNPPYIPGTSKPNPFFETMPAPEVWHRRMPSFFTGGETPYMEQVLSDQIDVDLKRNRDEQSSAPAPAPEPSPAAAPTIMSRISSAILGRSASASAAPEDSAPTSTSTKKGKGKAEVHDRATGIQPLRPTPWDLPNLSQEEFRRFMDGKPSAPAALRREQAHVPRRKRAAEEQLGGGVAKKRARG